MATTTVTYTKGYVSPIGRMTMASDGNALTGLWFDGQKYFGSTLSGELIEADLPIFKTTKAWLDAYFAGNRLPATPHLHMEGSAFRLAVWRMLAEIPYGHTTTYKDIAAGIASLESKAGMAAQAVGGAVGHNPISIIIPCHRVLSTDGGLAGYAGGLWRKDLMLKLERPAKPHPAGNHGTDTGITLRKATWADIPEIKKLFTDTIMAVNTRDYTHEEAADWALCGEKKACWEELVDGMYFIVAVTAGGDMAGFSSINDSGHLHFMFVHKDCQRQGVATLMLSQIEEYAATKGFREITSDVSITALPFFIRKGYIITARKKAMAYSMELINHRMVKRL